VRPPIVVVVLAALRVPACRPDASTARGTAERFLDAHYVQIDLPAALEFTTGVARHKVESELELVKGQPIDEATRKPSVYYTLLEERPENEHAVSYVYRGTITVEDADRFDRRWLLTVRFDGGGWHVTNYQEIDG
jgi:hypothetical protein